MQIILNKSIVLGGVELPIGAILKVSKEHINPADIEIAEVVPEQKDYDRAEGLAMQGSSFKGSGLPFASQAFKMAKSIKDPIKMVRRAKAVFELYGAGNFFRGDAGNIHHEDDDAFTPFAKIMLSRGFTHDQIKELVSSTKRKASTANFQLNEDTMFGDTLVKKGSVISVLSSRDRDEFMRQQQEDNPGYNMYDEPDYEVDTYRYSKPFSAKFPSRTPCPVCGNKISKGDYVCFIRGTKTLVHYNCAGEEVGVGQKYKHRT